MAVVKNNGLINSLDLFSGIAGFSQALKGITNTVAYCDNNEYSEKTLISLMKKHKLETRPICNDIRDLTIKWINDNKLGKIDMIVAGFPCIGFSPFGLLDGFHNDESNLFKHILRLVDETQCNIVFLENVPNILNLGIKEIKLELNKKRGFELRWCIIGANEVGAFHKRKRWFCIAIRKQHIFFIKDEHKYKAYKWSKKYEPDRMTFNSNPNRLHLLGNSVVPDAVRTAFFFLVFNFNCPKNLDTPKYIPFLFIQNTDKLNKYRSHSNGFVDINGNFHMKRSFKNNTKKIETIYLTFDSKFFNSKKQKSKLLTSDIVCHPVTSNFWTTPRSKSIYPSNYLTKRTIRDLASQVRFEKETDDKKRGGQVSPEFIEFLMGFPIGWTNY